MNTHVRHAQMRGLVLLVVAGAVSFACGTESPEKTVPIAPQAEGIPAPDSLLTDSSPVADFFRYGDSLRFASDTPGIITQTRLVGGVSAELRLRSEQRWQYTDSAAYVRGRIVAKFETVGATSAYGTPVGNAYLWVRDTGSGNFRGTLIWRDYVTGASGRTDVPYYLHSSPTAFRSNVAFCEDFSSVAFDTVRTCCLCFDGRRNCAMMQEISMAGLDSLLATRGRRE